MVNIKIEKKSDETAGVESKMEGTAAEVLSELLMAINQAVRCICKVSGTDRPYATALVMEMLLEKIDE